MQVSVQKVPFSWKIRRTFSRIRETFSTVSLVSNGLAGGLCFAISLTGWGLTGGGYLLLPFLIPLGLWVYQAIVIFTVEYDATTGEAKHIMGREANRIACQLAKPLLDNFRANPKEGVVALNRVHQDIFGTPLSFLDIKIYRDADYDAALQSLADNLLMVHKLKKDYERLLRSL